MCWVVCDLQLQPPCFLLIMTLLCQRVSPNLIGCMKTAIKRFLKSANKAQNDAGTRGEEGEEIYGDYIRMLSIKPCGSVAAVIKRCITPHWQPHETLTFFLPLALYFSPEFLNVPFTPLSFLSHHLSFPSIPPTRSALNPFLLLLSSISVWKQSCSLSLSFFFPSTQILRYPRPTMCPPPLIPVLSLHLRHDCEAAAITMFFEVSYYNIPNRDLSCQPSHITAQRSHLHLAGPPASALWRRVQAKLNRLEWQDHQTYSSLVAFEVFWAPHWLNNRTDWAN